MTKLIFILEGPAGSGKSTLIKGVADSQLWTPVPHPPIDRPRAYESDAGVQLSLRKDLLTAVDIISAPENSTLAVDRLFLSQYIYGSMRANTQLNPHVWFDMLDQAVQLTSMLNVNLQTRRFTDRAPEHLAFHYIFLLPGIRILEKNRVASGKSYPYAASREAAYYEKALDIFTEAEIPCSVIRYQDEATQLEIIPDTIDDLCSLIPEVRSYYDVS